MKLRQIETFAAVMNFGSASRAAEVLGITQPAVSRTIAELERAVGFSLFARMRAAAALILSMPWKAASTSLKSSLASGVAISRFLIRDHGAGEIRIASLSALGRSVVTRAVGAFRQSRSGDRVTLLVLPSRTIRDLITSGEYDVGIAADEIDETGVNSQIFMSCSSLCALPEKHPLAAKRVITPADLHEVSLIAYLPEDRVRQRLDVLLSAPILRPTSLSKLSMARLP